MKKLDIDKIEIQVKNGMFVGAIMPTLYELIDYIRELEKVNDIFQQIISTDGEKLLRLSEKIQEENKKLRKVALIVSKFYWPGGLDHMGDDLAITPNCGIMRVGDVRDLLKALEDLKNG